MQLIKPIFPDKLPRLFSLISGPLPTCSFSFTRCIVLKQGWNWEETEEPHWEKGFCGLYILNKITFHIGLHQYITYLLVALSLSNGYKISQTMASSTDFHLLSRNFWVPKAPMMTNSTQTPTLHYTCIYIKTTPSLLWSHSSQTGALWVGE